MISALTIALFTKHLIFVHVFFDNYWFPYKWCFDTAPLHLGISSCLLMLSLSLDPAFAKVSCFLFESCFRLRDVFGGFVEAHLKEHILRCLIPQTMTLTKPSCLSLNGCQHKTKSYLLVCMLSLFQETDVAQG